MQVFRKYVFFFFLLLHPNLNAQTKIAAFVRLDDKWFVIKENGQKLFERSFHYIDTKGSQALAVSTSFKTIIGEPGNYLFPIRENGYWGYMDTTGKTIIKPQFNWAFKFVDSIAIAMIDETNYKYINMKGQAISETQMKVLKDFSEGYGLFQKNLSWYYMDKKGNVLNKEGFDEAYSFNDGIARIKLHGKWGMLNTKGDFFIPPIYEELHSFSNGLAAFKKDSKWGFINKENQVVIPPIYLDIQNFSDGMAAVKGKSATEYEKWGYIDTTGKQVINFNFWDVTPFDEGIAAAKKDVLWGAINKQSAMVVPFQFETVDACQHRNLRIDKGKYSRLYNCDSLKFNPLAIEELSVPSEGLCRVIIDDKYGYLDSNNLLKIVAHFERAAHFKNGYARVKFAGFWGYIDKSGSFTIQPRYRNAEDFFSLN